MKARLNHMVEEALAYVQGESLKANAALLTEAFKLPDHQAGNIEMRLILLLTCALMATSCRPPEKPHDVTLKIFRSSVSGWQSDPQHHFLTISETNATGGSDEFTAALMRLPHSQKLSSVVHGVVQIAARSDDEMFDGALKCEIDIDGVPVQTATDGSGRFPSVICSFAVQ